MAVLVIPYIVEQTRYDQNGFIVERAGDTVVSHGVNEVTGKTVILPCEPWDQFVRQHCETVFGDVYLKEQG